MLLSGAGGAFCAGLDLSVLQAMGEQGTAEHRRDAERLGRMFEAVRTCPRPTIAAVHGAAVAGGTGLATLCDFTLAAPEAKFGYPEVKIGFVPALVSSYVRLQIGEKRARAMLLSGRLLAAEEALTLGLVDEVVPAGDLERRSLELARELAANSPAAMRATKELLLADSREWLEAAVDRAMGANAAARETPDFREGVSAFLGKRSPVWSG